MQCCMNGVVFNEVPKSLTPVPSETMHMIQVSNPSDGTHPIIIPLQLTRVINYFDVKKSNPEFLED